VVFGNWGVVEVQIDRLCLVQDDPGDVLNGMQTMDQIYEELLSASSLPQVVTQTGVY
jgi:hypothetical protein